MSIFGPLSPSDPAQDLTEVTPPASPSDAGSKTIVRIIIASAVMLVIAIGFGVYKFSEYSSKFNHVDHSADRMQFRGLPVVSQDPNLQKMSDLEHETTYSNAPSGVTLILPGMWRKANFGEVTNPALSHRFCILSSDFGFDVMFWPLFPDPRLSLASDAERMVARFSASGTFAFESQRDLTIHGLPAKELSFLYNSRIKFKMILVRKWPALYLLSVSGSPDATDSWKRVEDALPNSLEIR